MSRLIVKGLPKYVTEERLREHFASKGDITDIKLMKKRSGESRRFAFIGYKRQEDAATAVKFFNKSFIDTCKIDVEIAKTFSDPTVPLPLREMKKQAEEKLREREMRLLEQEERTLKKRKVTVDDEIAANPKLREYMEVMKPSHLVKSWANDDIADGKGAPSTKEFEDALTAQNRQSNTYDELQITENASDDEYEDFDKLRNKPSGEVSEEEEEEKMISLSSIPEDSNKIATDETVSDLDWLKQRRIHIRNIKPETETINEDVSEKHEMDEDENRKEIRQIQSRDLEPEVPKLSDQDIAVNKIQETGRLFIRNILYTSTEEDFRKLFSEFGNLEEVHVAIDTRTGKSKGYVYIQFKEANDAIKAFYALDKQIFQGRLLHILPADAKKDHRLDEFDLKNLPLKKQRELKRKEDASKAQFSWNSLYMNTDAIMNSVAAKLGVSKSQLIDPENSSSGVKQALAEAHVIGDVRKYFEAKGVDITQFDKTERDDKIILVKNFPYGTTVDEIGELFTQYGPLKRIVMPPAGTIAIVELRDLPSARAAFTKLAYRRFKKSIIYLEKGPKGLFTREPTDEEGSETKKGDVEIAKEAKVSANDVLEEKADTQDETFDGPTSSIFVKNLNFTTTSQQLSQIFSSLSGFVVAKIKTKPDPKKDGGILSMGFGFAEFKTKDEAHAAISALDGYVLDGHKLQLKISQRAGTAAASTKSVNKSKKSNKIIVKNLPFEATRKDVLELFSSFGELKSVRVPKKFDKSARGFAFVEFVLLKEAENAMDQLLGVHLLGRRLVMQYAEKDSENAEDEIDKMTKKVSKQVATQQLGAAMVVGKRKLDMGDEEDEFAM